MTQRIAADPHLPGNQGDRGSVFPRCPAQGPDRNPGPAPVGPPAVPARPRDRAPLGRRPERPAAWTAPVRYGRVLEQGY